MNSNEEMVYGRRVYFLCPHDAVRNDLVFKIIQNEFEVYTLDDPDIAREIVADTSSILFINVDAPDPGDSWADYVIGLKAGEEFSRLGIGIVTSRNSRDLRELYIMQIGVDCGVVTLQPGMDNVAHVVLEILRSNDAVGRRNSVRVNCADDPDIQCSLETSGESLTAKVLNLSSQGLACVGFSPRPPRDREYFHRILLDLHGEEVSLSGRFFDMRPVDGGFLYVIMYDRAVASEERGKVHKFVQQRLQQTVNTRLSGLQRQLERRSRVRITRVALLSGLSVALLAAALYFLL